MFLSQSKPYIYKSAQFKNVQFNAFSPSEHSIESPPRSRNNITGTPAPVVPPCSHYTSSQGNIILTFNTA